MMPADFNSISKALDSKVAEKIYDDGLSSPIKETSKFGVDLIKTFRLLFFPLQLLAKYQDRLENRLQATVQKIPDDQRIMPPDSILIPIMNHLVYIEDGNYLAELYQNLLAKSMDKRRNSEAHPGFITIISQLSPDEALMLYELKFKQFKFSRLADYDKEANKFSNIRMESNEFPVDKLVFSKNCDMYISHLEKLDLICVIDRQTQPLWKDTIQIGSRDTYTMGFTQFGDLFVRACQP